MGFEKQTTSTFEITRPQPVSTKLAAILGFAELFALNGAAAVVHDRQAPHEEQQKACVEQACGEVALQELLKVAIPTVSPVTSPAVRLAHEDSRQPKKAPPAPLPKKPAPKPSPASIPAAPLLEEGGDISFPQCRVTIDPKTKKRHWTYVAPHDVDFAVVGTTDYTQKDSINPCLTEELKWGLKVGLRGLYVNPRNDAGNTNPEQYGREQAKVIIQRIMKAMAKAGGNPDPSEYMFWLDIEPGVWSKITASNRAVVEGWGDELTALNVKFGLYSTGFMLRHYIGGIESQSSSSLVGRESWIPAVTCSERPLPTSPRLVMVQNQRLQHGTAFDINTVCRPKVTRRIPTALSLLRRAARQ